MKSESINCPYSNCGRSFEQPVMVTDYSKLPRDTYYACPHCMLRLDFSLDEGLGHVHVKTVEDGSLLSQLEVGDRVRWLGEPVSSNQATRPSKICKHYLGYLRSLPPSGVDIPDECGVCPNLMQCYVKRE